MLSQFSAKNGSRTPKIEHFHCVSEANAWAWAHALSIVTYYHRNIWFFPMLGTKTQLLWGNLSIFDTKTQIFPQFWPKNSNKNYFFFKLVNFWLYTQLFSQFLAHKILFFEKIDQFFALILNFPQIIGPAQPQLVPFFVENWSIFGIYTQFFNNFWPKKSFFFLL